MSPVHYVNIQKQQLNINSNNRNNCKIQKFKNAQIMHDCSCLFIIVIVIIVIIVVTIVNVITLINVIFVIIVIIGNSLIIIIIVLLVVLPSLYLCMRCFPD